MVYTLECPTKLSADGLEWNTASVNTVMGEVCCLLLNDYSISYMVVAHSLIDVTLLSTTLNGDRFLSVDDSVSWPSVCWALYTFCSAVAALRASFANTCTLTLAPQGQHCDISSCMQS